MLAGTLSKESGESEPADQSNRTGSASGGPRTPQELASTLLLIGYPYKAFTNPLFYLKLALIAAAVYLVVRIRRDVLLNPGSQAETILRNGRLLAMASLGCWIGVIAAGRFLAYTYTWLLVGMPNNF